MELLSEQGFRADGRRSNELRKMQCRLGIFSQSDGSAYMEQGNTKVLAAVYGPHEVRGSRTKILHDTALINCQYSMATFSTTERKKRPRGDRKSHEITSHLRQTFEAAIQTELYPKSQIDIYVEVLQSDGSNFSACVNAVTLALVDAGIPLRDYVCACTSTLVKSTALVDASYLEESNGGQPLNVAFLPRSEQMVLVEMASRVHSDHLQKLLDAATQGCRDVYAILDRAVRSHLAAVGACHGSH